MPQIVQTNPRVPIELVDRIVFYLRPPDLATPSPPPWSLLACSITCHQWRVVVLRHLFYKITCNFQSEPPHGAVITPTVSATTRQYQTISALCRFLESAPAIRACIHQLKLVGWWMGGNALHTGPRDVLVEYRLFARLLQLCPRVDVLHLHNVYLTNIEPPNASERRRLKVLKLVPCYGPSWKQMHIPLHEPGAEVAPLLFFSSIEHLHLSTLADAAQGLPPTLTFSPLEVHHLEVENSGYGVQPFVEALRQSGAIKTIRRFTTTQCYRNQPFVGGPEPNVQTPEITPLLTPSIHQVECRRIHHMSSEVAIVPDLSPCVQLRILSVGFDFGYADTFAVKLADTVVRLLRSVPPAAPLHRLDVYVALPAATSPGASGRHGMSQDVHAAFHAVDEALVAVADAHRCTLPWITVEYALPHDNGAYVPLEGVMQTLLPKLDAKKRLHVRRLSSMS